MSNFSILFCVLFAAPIDEAMAKASSTNTLDGDANVPVSCSDNPFLPCRTSKDILRSFLALVSLCAIVSVKPNMGRGGDGQWKLILRQLKLAFWAATVPELILFWALKQYLGAKSLQKEFSGQKWTIAHGHFMQMGGFMLYGADLQPIGILSSVQFRQLLLSGQIHFPEITRDEIRDRSKNNGPIRLFALSQVIWFFLQLSARGWRGLSFTALEVLMLCSILGSSILLYLWWDKPLNVRCSVHVQVLDENDSDYAEYISQTKKSNAENLPYSKEKLEREIGTAIKPGCMRVPTYYFVDITGVGGFNDTAQRTSLPLCGMATALLGAVYCLSLSHRVLTWPTRWENVLWKVCTTIVVAAICALLIEMAGLHTYHKKSGIARNFVKSYMIARFVMLILAGLSLRALPPTAYNTVAWTSSIPHI